MVNEVAIDPQAINSPLALNWLLASVGLGNGKLLSDCPPGKWVQEVGRAYLSNENLKEIESSKMEEVAASPCSSYPSHRIYDNESRA